MKRTNLMLTILTVLVAGTSLFAQNGGDYLPADEAIRAGRVPKTFPMEVYQRVPRGCPAGAKAYVINRDAKTGTMPSPELKTLMTQNTYRPTPRAYGERGIDKWFVDTLPLGSCKICAATLVADLVNEEGLSNNDGLLAWTADPSAIYGPGMSLIKPLFLYVFSSGAAPGKPTLWGPPAPPSKILTMDLNVAGRISDNITTNDIVGLPYLNNYIFTTTATPGLDVFIQDDTTVNSLQLVVWR